MSDDKAHKLHKMSAEDIEDVVYGWRPDPHPRIRAMKPVERAAYCMMLYKAAGDLIDAGAMPGVPRWRVAAHLGSAVRGGLFRIESDGLTVWLNMEGRLN